MSAGSEFATPPEVVDLLQQMIRNRCVNDGTVESGDEQRNVGLLESFFAGSGLATERHSSAPGRESLVARIEGSDRSAPSLLLMGHTDVVPVNESRWREDPFGGELIDDEIWGRGAIDMFNLTSSMAWCVRELARTGFKPRGDVIYLAVADEEAGGQYGAGHLLKTMPELVRADYVITESGGFPLPGADGTKLPVLVAEKGISWAKLVVTGTPGHGSMPFRTDNALIKGAEVVRRIGEFKPPTRIHDSWKAFVGAMGLPEEMTKPLTTEEGFVDAIAGLPIGLSRMAYSCSHTTIAPTVVHGGAKLNKASKGSSSPFAASRALRASASVTPLLRCAMAISCHSLPTFSTSRVSVPDFASPSTSNAYSRSVTFRTLPAPSLAQDIPVAASARTTTIRTIRHLEVIGHLPSCAPYSPSAPIDADS